MPQQDESTRRQILELIKRQGEMTAGQLSEAIGITSMGVRQHLNSMERDGLISTHVFRQKRGRPSYRFRLTDEADRLFPARYGQMAVDLLEQIVEIDGPDKVNQLFARRMDAFYRDYSDRMKALALKEKVEVLAAIRDQEGYMAESETDSEGTYTLIEYHCPIYEIARRFPQACHYEQELFARTLGADVQRDEHKITGDTRCRYVIKQTISKD